MKKDIEMSPEVVGFVAHRFKILSEPLRLQVLQVLERGEASVSEITNAVAATQPNVSKHLRILQDGGLVARRQDGNTVYYRIADESVFELCRVVCGSLKEKFTRERSIFA
jgi:DNA-binding transcriptional ArsR family regulator